ncbi:MAG: hypothetical protein AB1505_18290 [Candidatus Latescibacterota bacterium]
MERELAAQAVTRGPGQHFCGYYDKFPWNQSGRYLAALRTGFMERPPRADDRAAIGLVDLHQGDRWVPLAETQAWNWQQGTMLQWLGSDAEHTLVYNAATSEGFAAVVHDVSTGRQRVLPRPVYALSHDGRQAVTPNFARLAQTRPGYGYQGPPDPWEAQLHPADDGIWWMDVETGAHRLVVSLDQVVGWRHTPSMDGVKHWFNHLQFSTDDRRFVFLHRWVEAATGRRLTRMFTANPDGGDLWCLNEDEMTSHFDWRDGEWLLAWARRHGVGDRYFLFRDRTGQTEVLGEGVLTEDGHCSYSPDRRWVLTDTYPDRREGKRTLVLWDLERGERTDVGRFFAIPERITGEIRCDLHPRWSRDGRQVCFDSVHEGTRQVYVMDVSSVVG